jgi:hypothetical protein
MYRFPRVQLRQIAALPAFGLLLVSLAWSGQTEPDSRVTAKVLGEEIRTGDPEELRYLILGRLTDQYAADRGIEVSPEEIDAYIEHMNALRAKDRREREARRDQIQRELNAATLGDAERSALIEELDSLNQLLRDLNTTAGTPQESAEDAEARRTVAAAFIRQWKINQALYRDYGGRIGYQQGGPEPLDAYRRFLEAQQTNGAFEILDDDLGAEFWRYYTNDAIHSFYPAGSEEESRAFSQAWWLAE